MKKLVILRGPSGSGKTTIANYLSRGHFFEADQYFHTENGYHFNPKKLGLAHADCRSRVRESLESGEVLIVVSNTSTTVSEVVPYIELAKEYNYSVEIIRTPGPWDPLVLHNRNVHNVPLVSLEKQIARYVPIENETEWPHMEIFK